MGRKGRNSKMKEAKQNDNPDDSRKNVSSKQSKRSRRRKYPKPGEEGCRYIVLNDIPRTNQQQNPAAGSDALVPSGFEAVFENKKCQKVKRENNDIPRPNQQQIPMSAPGCDALVPPGFEAIFEARKRQRDNDSNVIEVGQTFTAVVQGEFDNGYWLSVRTGNSSPALSGILFKAK